MRVYRVYRESGRPWKKKTRKRKFLQRNEKYSEREGLQETFSIQVDSTPRWVLLLLYRDSYQFEKFFLNDHAINIINLSDDVFVSDIISAQRQHNDTKDAVKSYRIGIQEKIIA